MARLIWYRSVTHYGHEELATGEEPVVSISSVAAGLVFWAGDLNCRRLVSLLFLSLILDASADTSLALALQTGSTSPTNKAGRSSPTKTSRPFSSRTS